MTQDKIEKIIKENCDWGVNLNEEISAKEIYKLHLEAKLELLHTVNDEAYKYISTHEEIISNYCEELETKLKELE